MAENKKKLIKEEISEMLTNVSIGT